MEAECMGTVHQYNYQSDIQAAAANSTQAEAKCKFLCVYVQREKRLFMMMVVIFTNKKS